MGDYSIPKSTPVKTGKSPISPNQSGWAGSHKGSDQKKGGK